MTDTPRQALHAAARTLLARAALLLQGAGVTRRELPPAVVALEVAEKALRAALAEALGTAPARDQGELAEALAVRLGAIQADLVLGRPIDCQIDTLRRADETRLDALDRRQLTLAQAQPRRALTRRPPLRVVS
ncbi:MAG: hypothetical protein ACK4E3_10625 [Brevundimonas sp.]|uniref:hypothetical protein n=1 Tax=Brevundimonas sp. TaxID=1871086 RepID=UPI00391B3DA1